MTAPALREAEAAMASEPEPDPSEIDDLLAQRALEEQP